MTQKEFLIKIKANGRNAYTAKAIQLPGCFSQGRTKKQVLDNIKGAITDYIDYHAKQGKVVHVYNVGKPAATKVIIEVSRSARFRDPHYISLSDMNRAQEIKIREKNQRDMGLDSELPRSVSHNEVVKALERAGYEPAGGGSHDIFKKEGARRPIVVPRHDEINIGTMKEIIEEAGLTRWEFNMLLKGKTLTEIKAIEFSILIKSELSLRSNINNRGLFGPGTNDLFTAPSMTPVQGILAGETTAEIAQNVAKYTGALQSQGATGYQTPQQTTQQGNNQSLQSTSLSLLQLAILNEAIQAYLSQQNRGAPCCCPFSLP